MLQLSPGPVGSGSVSVTPLAMPTPPLVTLIAKPIVSLALALLLLGTFVTCNCGQSTVVVAPCVNVLALSALKVAVGDSAPQAPPPVAEAMCTVALAPVARLPKAQVRVCAPSCR